MGLSITWPDLEPEISNPEILWWSYKIHIWNFFPHVPCIWKPSIGTFLFIIPSSFEITLLFPIIILIFWISLLFFPPCFPFLFSFFDLLQLVYYSLVRHPAMFILWYSVWNDYMKRYSNKRSTVSSEIKTKSLSCKRNIDTNSLKTGQFYFIYIYLLFTLNKTWYTVSVFSKTKKWSFSHLLNILRFLGILCSRKYCLKYLFEWKNVREGVYFI